MFDKQAWDRNEWIDSKLVEEHFNMTFSECYEKFEVNRQAEWCKPPLNGQTIATYFRKHTQTGQQQINGGKEKNPEILNEGTSRNAPGRKPKSR